ncbi:TetR/AcrR family transcriptional regulator [Devosia algicola]|uniref:TetR/AcrR family transcriptional regulator n=1 Tax=Devosia algicola TaxID=3026418 RepID=A0ABY7YKV6_9HYPH|nr:TetR/AcrR family transcriptional regulator [Devosia algicola]WDR01919.1 TetR/AcrR family transcriptional regulator [Devosia algicola]
MPPADTRQSILHAAILLMGQNGMDGVTASALARQVGVSKATVFHHFPTLDEVPIAALDLFTEMMVPHDPDESADLEDILVALGATSLDLSAKQSGLVQAYCGFVTKAMFEQRLKVKLVAEMDAAVARLAAALAEKTRNAAMASELSRLCLVTMDGLMINAALTGDAQAQLALWRPMARLLAKEYGHENSN